MNKKDIQVLVMLVMSSGNDHWTLPVRPLDTTENQTGHYQLVTTMKITQLKKKEKKRKKEKRKKKMMLSKMSVFF